MDRSIAARCALPGIVTPDAARTQALIGFPGVFRKATAHLAAEVRNPFATLALTSLDGKAIAESGRMLLTAGARVSKTGFAWSALPPLNGVPRRPPSSR